MEIASKIAKAVQDGIHTLYAAEFPLDKIQLQETRPEFEGQLTLVVFPFLKTSR